MILQVARFIFWAWEGESCTNSQVITKRPLLQEYILDLFYHIGFITWKYTLITNHKTLDN